MRDDMHEVIIERPRRGSRMRHVRRLRRIDPKHTSVHDPESLPFRIGHGRAANLNKTTKEFSDLLGPLKRYLARQVNRPWNKVWSEISANIKASNPAQRHVLGHVLDLVATKTSLRDGEVWVTKFGRLTPLRDAWHHQLYVDPRTGILRRNKHYKRWTQQRRDREQTEARERAHRMRELGPLLQAHRLKECWWEVTLAPVPSGHRWRDWPPVFDVVRQAGLSALPPHELYGRRDVYAVKRRQLTSAEITRLGLRT